MKSLTHMAEHADRTLEHEALDEALKAVRSVLDPRIARATRECDTVTASDMVDPSDFSAYRDHLGEVHGSLLTVRQLAGELAIIGLYKAVETQTVRVFMEHASHPTSDPKELAKIQRDLSRFCTLKSSFKKDTDKALDELAGFKELDELRLINNALKHNGEVSEELAGAFPRWKVVAPFPDLEETYARLLPGVVTYVSEFGRLLHIAAEKRARR